MTKILLIVLCGIFIISCKETSDIKPLARAKTISEKFDAQVSKGSKEITIPIKISLTQNLLPRYDLQDILGEETEETEEGLENKDDQSLPQEQKSFLKRFTSKLKSAIKYRLYNLGLSVGIQNTYKISFAYGDFPEIDSKYIKSLKMKKLFFAIEPCDIEDVECHIQREDKPSSLLFLKKFFLNISALQTSEDLAFLSDNYDEAVIYPLKKEEFNEAVSKALGKQPTDFNDLEHRDPVSGKIDGGIFYDLNVAMLDGKKISNELNQLKKNKHKRDDGKVFIARVESGRVIEAKNFFTKPAFKNIVKDITILKRSLFIELYSPELRGSFFRTVNSQSINMRDVGVYDIEGCTLETCAEVKVNPINLVPMLEKSNKIKFDTYISVNELDANDFRYSGFLELEIKLELPL